MKKISIDSSSWLHQKIDEALAAPYRRDVLPPPFALSAEEGAADVLEILQAIEAFGLPDASREPIPYHDLLM